ncbi:MAG: HEAT repeat domain-containing protein [Verrucomicrobiia bacterium]
MKRLITVIGIGLVCFLCDGAEADFLKTIDGLLPTIGSANVPDRYSAQMQLQKIVVNTGRPGAETERKEMSTALCKRVVDKTVAQPARVWLVRMLEYIGGDESVETLMSVMKENDPELRECARRALEKNPSKAALTALRGMLATEQDKNIRIGLIHSLGEKRDADSVAQIAKFLDTPETAQVAALALGKIATEPAIGALTKALNKVSTAGDALIEAANRNLLAGNTKLARSVYQIVYDNGKEAITRGAALVGLAKADPEGSFRTVSAALNNNSDELLQRAAIIAIKEGYKDYSRRLMASFPALNPQAKIHILGIVDKSVEGDVIKATKETEQTVRVAAINSLSKIGGATSAPVLISIAASDSQPEKSAAESALAAISGTGVDAAIEKAALSGETASRVVAINSISSRRQVSSVPVLMKLISDNDAEVKKAAMKAIGRIGGDNEFETIAKIAAQNQSKDAIAILESLAQRVSDKSAAANKVINVIGNDSAKLISFINVLVALGTDECLKPISGLLKSADVSAKETALKALSQWQSLSAVSYLLPVATDQTVPQNQYNLALRAVTQIVKNSENGDVKTKADALIAVFNNARSDGDKKLVISAMAMVPEQRIANTLKTLIGDEKFKQEAAQAGIAVAEALSKTDRTTARELAAAIRNAKINDELTKRASRIR